MKTTLALVSLLSLLAGTAIANPVSGEESKQLSARQGTRLPSLGYDDLNAQYSSAGSKENAQPADSISADSVAACPSGYPYLCYGRCCRYNICCANECCAPNAQFCLSGYCYRWA
ncbi:hypothetical protein QBC43DRAFT_371049 [Cladorrhinum sp. PSN259]|nr:hypothetical protein QBC43DRAFT_371049 [Cladorrhinum sp. PSN259]